MAPFDQEHKAANALVRRPDGVTVTTEDCGAPQRGMSVDDRESTNVRFNRAPRPPR